MPRVHVIKMPDIGEGIAEVELVVWRVQPGDAVAEDQILADVMTDKATVEIPSPVAGTVLALGGTEATAPAKPPAKAPAPATPAAPPVPRAAPAAPPAIPSKAVGERPIAPP